MSARVAIRNLGVNVHIPAFPEQTGINCSVRVRGGQEGLPFAVRVNDLHTGFPQSSTAIRVTLFSRDATAALEPTPIVSRIPPCITGDTDFRELLEGLLPRTVMTAILGIIKRDSPHVADMLRDRSWRPTVDDIGALLSPDAKNGIDQIIAICAPHQQYSYTDRRETAPSYLYQIDGLKLIGDPCLVEAHAIADVWVLRIDFWYEGCRFFLEMMNHHRARLYYQNPARNGMPVLVDQMDHFKPKKRLAAVLRAIADDSARASAIRE